MSPRRGRSSAVPALLSRRAPLFMPAPPVVGPVTQQPTAAAAGRWHWVNSASRLRSHSPTDRPSSVSARNAGWISRENPRLAPRPRGTFVNTTGSSHRGTRKANVRVWPYGGRGRAQRRGAARSARPVPDPAGSATGRQPSADRRLVRSAHGSKGVVERLTAGDRVDLGTHARVRAVSATGDRRRSARRHRVPEEKPQRVRWWARLPRGNR